MALKLTEHFEKRWTQYFRGDPPHVGTILRIIGQSVIIDVGQNLKRLDGRDYKLLSTYWHPGRGLVIKVDWLSDPPEAVTVIGPEARRKKVKGKR